MKRLYIIVFVIVVIVFSAIHGFTEEQNRNCIETSIIDPFFSIYFLKYTNDITSQSSLLTGGYYLYSEKAFSGENYPGTYQGLSLFIGYRRYIINKLYIEDQIMPMYAIYEDSHIDKKSTGFELWNEIHLGYKLKLFDSRVQLVLNPQVIFGICVYENNEPISFKKIEGDDRNYMKNLYLLPNILIGIAF
jgi:hypothetical protein